jgi:phenylacetate-coenzyme A ligase PaaK-like adenylate-forming protein
MTKADLMANFDEIVTDSRLNLARCRDHLRVEATDGGYLDDKYRVSISGGSSGVHALMVYSWPELARLVGICLRILYRWGDRSGTRLYPTIVAGVTTPNPVFRAVQPWRFFGAAEAEAFPINWPLEEIVAGLNRVQPNVLFVYPSSIPRLISEAEAGRLRITPAVVIVGAEPLLAHDEKAISHTWKCPVINGWGTTEAGTLGMSSGFDPGLLLMDDEAIIEAVDRHGMPVAPGERAEKVYVTPLFRTTLPLLRYELSDQFLLLPTRPRCGSGFRLISDVEARLDDYFRYEQGVEIPPQLFLSVLDQESAVLEFQVRQTEVGAHVLVTSSSPVDWGQLGRSIAAEMSRFMIAEPVVTIEQVDQIPRTGEAAKLKHFVPLANQSTNH